MAKRKEIILQEILNSQDAWDGAMNSEKLYVVDAHQKWCGPCTAIVGMLKRIKNELGDDLLRFATADVNNIESLEQYRGKCEPNFLFFASGQLVAAVRGCNAPLVQHTIQTSLQAEHKVLNGEAERKVIRDIQNESPDEGLEEDEEEDFEEGVVPKQVTVALIKPDVVQNGQADEILTKIEDAGIEVLVNEERMLSEEEARQFYNNKSNEDFFGDLVNYITSGPCRVLVLTKGETGEGVVDLWRDIIGPFDAAVAKVENENSLRAIYGIDATCNALHGSTSSEEALRELGFFFPNFRPPTFKGASSQSRAASRRSAAGSRGEPRLQKTLAIIRPDALARHKDAILEKIKESGFKIAMQKEMTLTKEQAEEFYVEHKDSDYFEPLVKQMTCGPVLALCLVREDAVDQWRSMLGPKIVSEAAEQQPESLRAQFAVEEAECNMIHGSDSVETAQIELSKIFHVDQTLAVIKPDAIDEKENIINKLQEAGFMISCQKDMSLTREIAEQIYKNKEGAEYYESLINHMTSGSTMMMVLSAEDAVNKLRSLMGPVDPEVAREKQPESLRARFAKSILENAIHSPSTKESAEEKIRVVFGDTQFDWDGTAKGIGSDVENIRHLNTGVGEGEKTDDNEGEKDLSEDGKEDEAEKVIDSGEVKNIEATGATEQNTPGENNNNEDANPQESPKENKPEDGEPMVTNSKEEEKSEQGEEPSDDAAK